MNFKQHTECFNKLLDNFYIAQFLKRDRCGVMCDKYHLIIVFQFFMRAGFKEEDYTPRNFFLALTLSHDLYDESKTIKQMIMAYYWSLNDGPKDGTKIVFHWDKLRLFKSMQYKGLVDRKICQNLCQLVSHKAFERSRREIHTGYLNNKVLCNKCRCPVSISVSYEGKKIDAAEEKPNKNTTPCNIEDVSTMVIGQKVKKSRKSSTDKDNSKTPCNVEDVSAIVTGQNQKKARRSSSDNAKELFFRYSEPEFFTVEQKTVSSSC